MSVNKLLVTFLAILLIMLGAYNKATATHAMGADLSFQCLGNDSFAITLNLYRDCIGSGFPGIATVDISSVSCNIPSLSLILTPPDSVTLPTGEVVANGADVSDLCGSANSSCQGGNQSGVEVTSYTGIIQLPAQCTDWIIGYSLCCRNGAITNLVSPQTNTLYVETQLSNAGGLCNNSPIFTSLPVPYFCAGIEHSYNQGVFDIDGDSLAFSCINPLSNPGFPILHVPGLGPCNPMNGTFALNSVTGQMTFTPTGAQNVVITILVEEFRNGILIGTTMRDIQMTILNQPNCSVPQVDPPSNLSGVISIDSTKLIACPGATVTFTIISSDPDSTDIITMTSSANLTVPGSNFTVTNPTTNSAIGTFTWIPTSLDTGNNLVFINVEDNNCPIPGRSIIAVNIFILTGTTAGPDLFYCPAGGPVKLEANGGSSFTWSPTAGLSNPNIKNPLASPTVTTDYIVFSDLDSNICQNFDTVTVFVVPDFILSISPEDTICRNSSTELNVQADAFWAPYTYSWTPLTAIINENTPNPIVSPISTTTYIATVTSDTGCVIKDSAKINVIGVGPIVEILADKNNVCPGDSVQLNGQIFPLLCGPSLSGCSINNIPSAKLFGNNTAVGHFATPFEGSSEDARFQALYRATDLIAAGINTGTITRLEFEVASKASNFVYQNLTIKIGCTSNDNLDLANWESTGTIVFGPAIFATNLGAISFALSTPYDWDGRTNLIVEICYNNGALSSPGGNDQLLSMATNYNASMRSFSNNTDGCLLNPQFINTQIPKTTFYICDPIQTNKTIQWVPAAGLTDPTILNPKTAVTEQITYTLLVTDSICDGSDAIILNTDTSFSIEVITDGATCGGDSAQLEVLVLGIPPINTLPCGVNGSTCTSTNMVEQVGSGLFNTGFGSPYRGFWHDARVQYLYKASELIANGIVNSGIITEMAWDVAFKTSLIPYSGFTIKMGCTSLNELTNNFVSSSLTTVYGPTTYSSISGWNTHVFNAAFDWDGSSNIIVEVCFDNIIFTNDDATNYTTTNFNSVVYAEDDTAIGCILFAETVSANRPNARFTICDAPTGTANIAWSPNIGLSDSTIANPVAFPDTTTTYTVAYTFLNGCTIYDSVTVAISNFFITTSPNAIICPGENTQLLASGGTAYSWDSLPGLSCYNCSNPIANPVTTTTYVVTVTDTATGCSGVDSILVSVYDVAPIKFGGDTMQCFLDSFRLDAGSSFINYQWNTGDTTSFIWVTVAGTYAVTVVNSNGCTSSDSTDLEVNPSPVVNLGLDTVLCQGDSVTLNAGSSFTSYRWDNMTFDSTRTVYNTGLYSVVVADSNACPGSDSISVIFNGPFVDLGTNIGLCNGDTILLLGSTSDDSHLWSDGSNDTFLVVTTPANYSVTITDDDACQSIDSVDINLYPDNNVDLGADITICSGENTTINAGYGYDSYYWSNHSTSQGISIFISDAYSVTVVDSNSCVSSDTVIVSVVAPTVNLGADQEICEGDTTTLNAGAGFTNYQWNVAEETSSTLAVTIAGSYSVTVSLNSGCTATDDILVNVNNLPNPDLGTFDTVCPGFLLFPGNFSNYLWQDASTDPTFATTAPGLNKYSVTVTDNNSCANSDSIDLFVRNVFINIQNNFICNGVDSAILRAPFGFSTYLWSTQETTDSIIVFNEGNYCITVSTISGTDTCFATDCAMVTTTEIDFDMNDTIICPGIDSVLITAPANFESYIWSTGQTDSMIYVKNEGDFTVTVTDEASCQGEATANVAFEPLNVVASANTDPPVTDENGQSILSVDVNNGSGFYNYMWTSVPPSNIETPSNSATPITITEETIFFIDATDTVTGCTDRDSIIVILETLFGIPSAFTPGIAGENDNFQVAFSGTASFTIKEFKIYNRWGELISEDVNGWNGTYDGVEQPMGTYVYYIVILKADNTTENLSGVVSLLR